MACNQQSYEMIYIYIYYTREREGRRGDRESVCVIRIREAEEFGRVIEKFSVRLILS